MDEEKDITPEEKKRMEEAKNNTLRKATKEANKLRKKVIAFITKYIPIILMALKVLGILACVIGIIALFNSILDGDGENEDDINGLRGSSRISNLQEYLRQFSHSTEAPQSEDGKFYKLYGDGAGWPTIGNSDLQWKSHEDKFACQGEVMHNDEEKTVDNVQEFVNSFLTRGSSAQYTDEEIDAMNIYIEKELVDSAGDSTSEGVYQYVVNITEGLDLSQQQLYALTSIAYNFGHLPTRNGYTFVEVYEEGAGLYEINSWKHNRYIWDNWWAYVGGGYAGHVPARDAAFETYVKGVFDFSESDAGEVFSREYYIYYTQEQLDYLQNYDMTSGQTVPEKPITRTTSNEEEIFTYNEATYLDSYDGEVVTAAGYSFPHYLQNNYGGKYGTSTIAASGCGPTSMAMILAGFCNDYSITPITFIENMDEYYHGDYTQYYSPGVGSIYAGICNATFLQKYYNCTSVHVSSTSQALQAIAEGKAVIGREAGHVLAIIPLPNEYRNQGYAFYVLDSARGHDGPFKTIDHFISSTSATMLEFMYIIQPN